jgi:pyruvate formate lyase activating enzyme
VTGAHLAPVLDTLVYLKRETHVWLEVTTLLIPGLNDSEAELDRLTRWIVEHLGPDVPLHFTAFHPDWKMRDVPATPPETLRRARAQALKNGVRWAYTGNLFDDMGESTFCHACGEVVIGRSGYRLTRWALSPGGACSACGALVAGVFEDRPGAFDGRPQRVVLSSSD